MRKREREGEGEGERKGERKGEAARLDRKSNSISNQEYYYQIVIRSLRLLMQYSDYISISLHVKS